MIYAEIYDYIVKQLRSGACEIHGNEVQMKCPGCGIEDHFSININNGMYNCYKCTVGGCVAGQIVNNRSEWSSLTRNILSEHPPVNKGGHFPIDGLAGNPLSDYLDGVSHDGVTELAHKQTIRAVRYCFKRGMTEQQIKDYKVLIKPFDSKVYFPYWDEDGKVIFWTSRATNDLVERKTLTTDNSSNPLFGRHVKINRKEVVLVEGPFDHFATPDSYAILGSSVCSAQIIQLREDGIKRIFLIMDPDAGEQMKHTTRKLANFRFDVFPVMISGGKDPAKLGRKKMESIVRTVKLHHPVRPQTIYFNP